MNEVITWDNAHEWQEAINEKWDDFHTPKWSWDCGLKLNFDGEVIGVSSRFYPEGNNEWSGNLEILLMGETLKRKSFETKELNKLKDEVELYIIDFTFKLKDKIKEIINEDK